MGKRKRLCPRFLTTMEAADLLNLQPNALRLMACEFGCPRSSRGPSGHRQFAYEEVVRLRDALRSGNSVAAAAARVLAADPGTLHEVKSPRQQQG
jgi:hypothetical protein